MTYLSKLVERAVCDQITHFVAQTGNTKELQSAYHEDHSMEIALLKVKMYLLAALDSQEISCLILLNLSAAFDTVSHKLLLNHLKNQSGFAGKIFEWIRDYLSNHTQQVKVDDSESELIKLKYGVPQIQFWVPYYSHYTPACLVTFAENMELSTTVMQMTHKITSPSHKL